MSAKKNKAPYRTSLQDFKLQLIKEVKKHDIIWTPRAGRKGDTFKRAWDDVLKALMRVYKNGRSSEYLSDRIMQPSREGAINYCQYQWKELKSAYRDHLSPNCCSTMSEELVAHMAFMEPYLNQTSLQKSSLQLEPTASTSGLNSRIEPIEANKMTVEPAIIEDDFRIKMELMASVQLTQSQCEPIPSTSTANDERDNTMPPKPTKAETPETRKSSMTAENSSVARAQALAVLDYLFSSLTSTAISQLRAELVRSFVKLQPEDNEKILAHATSQMPIVRNCQKIDWSNLDISADVCQAVWLSHVNERFMQKVQRAG